LPSPLQGEPPTRYSPLYRVLPQGLGGALLLRLFLNHLLSSHAAIKIPCGIFILVDIFQRNCSNADRDRGPRSVDVSSATRPLFFLPAYAQLQWYYVIEDPLKSYEENHLVNYKQDRERLCILSASYLP